MSSFNHYVEFLFVFRVRKKNQFFYVAILSHAPRKNPGSGNVF